MKRYAILVIALVSCLFHYAQAQPRVIVLGFDGLSGQGIQKTATPHFDFLKQRGAYTYKAEAVIRTVSSPNWASMISGASPKQHQVKSNDWERKDIRNKSYCGQAKGEIFPTIFKIIREQKPSAKIACVHDWDGFARLANTEAMDTIISTEGEYQTCEKACAIIQNMKPDFLFVHFDHVDHAGHETGHFTEEYYRSIRVADSLTGIIIQALKNAGVFNNTYIIITADHGGRKKGHGGRSRAEIEIPWIISGPKTKQGFAITDLVKQYDTASTIAHIFGLQQPDCWTGKPVKSAFADAP
ncbi:MAG: alkaline phosphatase [Chitinophagales bacterium]|nr:alkaline phosphatase [Chitinophagales bacterium]